MDPRGTNIQVVVRCRERSAREVRENSAVVVRASGGVRGRDITVAVGLGALSDKTYSFDRVFGPEADQTLVYDDVVAPILDEMLLGYNCTVFAYGQTGTGKTYTMSGDMAANVPGAVAHDAGIIPRTLYSLFRILDAQRADYSVKVSFIELYNEDLRDLLAPDDDGGGGRRLKIYDDAQKRGILIQGLDESLITTAAQGVKKLQLGSYKRQVAATKCNDLSSRSHTVFTITVHIKEATDGEDLLRVGKLNLVDLAGSENIGRSGAENKQAREAGVINQSLLTLGRVINALVSRSQHIPYRESKLTRLLQDSLGGRTKTCIIATVSPAKVNLDETISTLEYANKAKSIHNKPQVNQMMTKKTLLSEFCVEIERLKADLRATRAKQGIYLTEESYRELTEQNDSRQNVIEEHERKIEALDIQLRSLREQYSQSLQILADTKSELEQTAQALLDTRQTLVQTALQLDQTKSALGDEISVRKAHESTEQTLDHVAHELKSAVGLTTLDIEALHEKIERKAKLEAFNSENWTKTSARLAQQLFGCSAEISEHNLRHKHFGEHLNQKLYEFVSSQTEKLQSEYQSLQQALTTLEEERSGFASNLSHSESAVDELMQQICSIRAVLTTRIAEGLNGLNASAERISREIINEMVNFQQGIHNSYSEVGRNLKSLIDHTTKHIEAQSNEMRQLRTRLRDADKTADAKIAETMVAVESAVEGERERSRLEKQTLLSQITSMFDSMVATQLDRLCQLGQTQSTLNNGIANVLKENSAVMYDQLISIENQCDEFGHQVQTRKDEIRSQIVGAANWANDRSTAMQESAQSVHAETIKLVSSQMTDLDGQTQILEDFASQATELNKENHEAYNRKLNSLAYHSRETHLAAQIGISKAADSTVRASKMTSEGLLNRVKETDKMSQQVVQTLQDANETVNSTKLLIDVPTGQTPQKRIYLYPNNWTRTKSRDEILERDREQHIRLPLCPMDINADARVEASKGAEAPKGQVESVSSLDRDAIPVAPPAPPAEAVENGGFRSRIARKV